MSKKRSVVDLLLGLLSGLKLERLRKKVNTGCISICIRCSIVFASKSQLKSTLPRYRGSAECIESRTGIDDTITNEARTA